MDTERHIRLRGVRVHNLKGIDLDLPLRKLIVISGVSGSGKSSLAFDTLYAEGQRRYIESFSAYTRQFLDRLDKPDAESIEGIPPALAIAQKQPSRSSRSTVATVTEIADYLRLLYAKIGRVFCDTCGREVRRDSPAAVADAAAGLPEAARFLITYPVYPSAEADMDELAAGLKEDGFVRAVVGERMINLNNHLLPRPADGEPVLVVVDRLTAGQTAMERVTDSVEIAFQKGVGRCVLLVEGPDVRVGGMGGSSALAGRPYSMDGTTWTRLRFNERLRCDDCNREFPTPEPRLYSFNSPLGACPRCEGFGNIIDIDMNLVVPDPSKSLRDGAVAPWNTPAYVHERHELMALADDYGIPVDVPWSELEPEHVALVVNGVPERDFGGLCGFFAWLERRKYKMHVRVFLSRWRSYRPCPECKGTRLKPIALATKVGGKNIAEASAMKVGDAARFFAQLELTPFEEKLAKMILEQLRGRIGYLETVGLEYLTLDRTTRTLSGGEAQRVALTSALGCGLVNTLYVLDEPSIGLHPRDTGRLIDVMKGLRDRPNTVVVVEHEEAVLRAADQIVDIGPGAGDAGGEIVFQGTPEEIVDCTTSITGDYLAGRRQVSLPPQRRPADRGRIRMNGARANNLKNLTVEFPLGLLCVVTGVSGAGKSSLIEETLYPALCRRLRKEVPSAEAARQQAGPTYDEVIGDGQIDDVQLVDQSPIGRSPRSNPVTYIKAFDEIRRAFAGTTDAKVQNFGPGHFSFNVEGGRCSQCDGNGYIQIDMQFLADVFMKCTACDGTRYRREVLDVKYRGKNIAEVLEMTVREAFAFFRGRPKVQARLKMLLDVGLDYLRLGQPANTLSGGEAQRLKLAAHLSAGKGGQAAHATRRRRCLFLLDEPTTGLHFADIVRLLDCFNALLSVGHSLIVVEHNLDVIKCADYIIDLGPGAADEGGRVVTTGTPEQIAAVAESITGQFLAPILAEERRARRA